MTLRFAGFQPNLITDTDEFAQRLDIARGLSEQHLDFRAAEFVNPVGGGEELVHCVHGDLRPDPNTEVAGTKA